MTKSDATALGVVGFGAAVLALIDSAGKNTQLAALGRQVSGLGQHLRVRTARVAGLESERGELLRALDVATGGLARANHRIDTLNSQVSDLQGQLTAKDVEIAQLREELAAANGAKKP
jgi:chromosome segregation ATPase